MSADKDIIMEVEANGSSEKPIGDGLLVEDIEQSFVLIQKASANFDNRYISKVFRDLGGLRRRLTVEALSTVINKVYPDSHPHKAYLVDIVGSNSDEMEVDESNAAILPEVDIYIHLLIQVYLLDKKDLVALDSFNGKIVDAFKSYNLRTLDFISAKIWFYIARTKELLGDLVSVRPALLAALRTATLRHDIETSASIITLLLRNYLLTHDIGQASNLVEKTEFPENAANALVARYYYYLAKINAIQLDYSTAHECVIAAIRKAPQTTLANGFLQTAQKLNIVIELLMGDIPELKLFKQPLYEQALQPYMAITRAVRLGDLKLFGETLTRFEGKLKKDDTYTLVSRLRQNVIKTGIRIISLSYSKISLKDICIKLHLDSEESTEYIVGKAIRDGVIDATIDHERGFMQSKELLDVYSTKLPQAEFDQRIKFCLSLYNDSVKSMRYPMSTNRVDLKSDLLNQERESELLQAIQDGNLDDFF